MIESLERVFTRLESTDKYDAIDEVISKCSIFDELEDKEKFSGDSSWQASSPR